MHGLNQCVFLSFISRAVFLPGINVLEQKSESKNVCPFKVVGSLGLSAGEETSWES